jgi:hypothetical protein
MEVYEPVAAPATFVRTLAARARACGATAVAVDGRRHVERFAPLRPRARR